MIPTLLGVVAVVLVAGAGPPQVVVRPLAGPEQTGALKELDSQHMTVTLEGRTQQFTIADLQAVLFSNKSTAGSETERIQVQLLDGSVLASSQYTVADRVATVAVGDRELKIPTRAVRSVRFDARAKALDGQWQESLAGQFAGDIVVLRRETSLDQLEGILHDITSDIVEFEFENETIPVKRTKLEGIVYLNSTTEPLPKVICKVHTIGGTIWCANELRLDGDKLRVVTAGGIASELLLADLARLDFASGNVVYLSDKEPESVQWTPFVASGVAAERLARMFRPRRDRSFEGDALWLGAIGSETRYSKGLCIHSRTLLTYRVGGEYRKFTAVAGIDSRLQGRGNVQLVIMGDNKTLFQKAISGADAPLMLDLDVQGVQRLKILVDFGQSADIGDHLNLCDARLIK